MRCIYKQNPINMKYLKVSLVLVRLVVFVYNESTYYKN